MNFPNSYANLLSDWEYGLVPPAPVQPNRFKPNWLKPELYILLPVQKRELILPDPERLKKELRCTRKKWEIVTR